MSRDTPESLTVAEWKVMKIVWRQKSCSAREVYEEAGKAHGWAPSTTKTLLRRLIEKRHLTATPDGFKIVDIFSAGASLVQMERDTFVSVMRYGGLSELMAKLDARTKSLANAAP